MVFRVDTRMVEDLIYKVLSYQISSRGEGKKIFTCHPVPDTGTERLV